MRVGFVGLGDMGAPMSKHIIAGGFELTVFDLREEAMQSEAMQSLVERGARRAADLPTLAAACDIVFICVVNDEQVLAVVDEISAGLRRGAVVVVVSGVLPKTMEHVNAQLEPRGVAVLDGPVTGSRPEAVAGAAAGTLTMIVGGAAEIVDSVRPVLDTFAKEVIRVGTVGTGHAVKIANNMMLHMNHLIAIEAVEFAKAHGLDEQTVLKVANVGTGRSWVTETWDLFDEMLSDDPIGIYDTMTKAMWNAVLMSKAAHVDLPLTGLGVQLSRRMLERRVAEQLASGQGQK
jgi:3-hydroxyisobutyrate dehydrogenase